MSKLHPKKLQFAILLSHCLGLPTACQRLAKMISLERCADLLCSVVVKFRLLELQDACLRCWILRNSWDALPVQHLLTSYSYVRFSRLIGNSPCTFLYLVSFSFPRGFLENRCGMQKTLSGVEGIVPMAKEHSDQPTDAYTTPLFWLLTDTSGMMNGRKRKWFPYRLIRVQTPKV